MIITIFYHYNSRFPVYGNRFFFPVKSGNMIRITDGADWHNMIDRISIL